MSFINVLCPVDLSPGSSQALRYAVALTRASAGKLFVLHVLEPDAIKGAPDREAAVRMLEGMTHGLLGGGPGASPRWESVIVKGEPDVEIPRQAAERGAQLIVMHSRRRPYAAALLGSVTESVCRTAPCPILVTHEREREWTGFTTHSVGLQRILVAHDFSGDSELALMHGLALAREYHGELHILHVLPTRPRPITPEIARLPFATQRVFDETLAAIRTAVPAKTIVGVKLKYAVREGHTYREVLGYAEDQQIELICMGASGTGFGMRALFGSNSDRVLRQAPCPILIARPLRPLISPPISSHYTIGAATPNSR